MRADGAQHLDGEAERQAIAQGDPAERLAVTLRAVRIFGILTLWCSRTASVMKARAGGGGSLSTPWFYSAAC